MWPQVITCSDFKGSEITESAAERDRESERKNVVLNGQSYKHSTIINYNDIKICFCTILES